MSTTDNEAGSTRLGEFEDEVAGLRIKGGSIERERQLTSVGLGLVVVGAVLALLMVMLSSGASDSRDQYTYLSVGLFALILAIVGSVVWLRFSLTRYLRYWLLRLIYEERNRSGS